MLRKFIYHSLGFVSQSVVLLSATSTLPLLTLLITLCWCTSPAIKPCVHIPLSHPSISQIVRILCPVPEILSPLHPEFWLFLYSISWDNLWVHLYPENPFSRINLCLNYLLQPYSFLHYSVAVFAEENLFFFSLLPQLETLKLTLRQCLWFCCILENFCTDLVQTAQPVEWIIVLNERNEGTDAVFFSDSLVTFTGRQLLVSSGGQSCRKWMELEK